LSLGILSVFLFQFPMKKFSHLPFSAYMPKNHNYHIFFM
jgi:hypothetical protein